MTGWRFSLAGCVIVFAACAPVALAGDGAPPKKPDSIFDDAGDSGTLKPKPPKPPEPKPEPESKKSSPTEPTNPPATEPPQQRPPAPAPLPEKPTTPPPTEPSAPARLPVPAQAAQDKALKLVKDVFAEDYRKKAAADRVALAGRLIEQASDAGNDATTKYVMLREARDLAVAAGDVATAMSAVDAMTEAFVVNTIDLKTELLTAAAKKPADAAAAAAVAEGFAELADQALADADIDRANKMIAQAESVAKKAKDNDLIASMSRRKKELREFVSAFGALGPMKEKLKKSPDDPAANLALGKFYCFAAGNWDQGLPMLVKGSDAALQKLARADLAGAENPQAQATVGDGWFDLSEKPNAAGKSQLRARAGHWYEKAVTSLSGLEKARVEKRVASIQSDPTSGTSASSATPEEKGIRMLEAIVAKIPAEARPKTGKAMDQSRVGRMLTGQLFKTPIDAELVMSQIESMTFNGRESTYASFQQYGPKSIDGADYTLRIVIDTRKQITEDDLAKLTPGTRVRVRAIIKDVDILRYFDSDRNYTNHYQMRVTLADPTLSLLADRPAAGAGKRDGAPANAKAPAFGP